MLANSIIPSRADSGCGGCASCEPTTPKDPFTLLVHEIREYLGLSSGINSSDVDTEHLRALMAKYTSNPAEWERYARADLSRNYTRNLVDSVNGKANLVCYTPPCTRQNSMLICLQILIVWNPTKGSLIHDHADAHCIMKILEGRLTETIYHMPDSKTPPQRSLQVKKETVYVPDEVAYISDTIGLHRVFNPDPEKFAMSLHRKASVVGVDGKTMSLTAHAVYTPPNAAEFGFNVYDEKTGKKSHVPGS